MTLSSSLREAVFARDNFTCVYCGERPIGKRRQVDHVIPRSRGGLDTFENLVTSCQKCNVRKMVRLLTFTEVIKYAPDLQWNERYVEQGRVCRGCGGIIEHEGDSMCSCRKEAVEVYCEACGEPLIDDGEEICGSCRDDLYGEKS